MERWLGKCGRAAFECLLPSARLSATNITLGSINATDQKAKDEGAVLYRVACDRETWRPTQHTRKKQYMSHTIEGCGERDAPPCMACVLSVKMAVGARIAAAHILGALCKPPKQAQSAAAERAIRWFTWACFCSSSSCSSPPRDEMAWVRCVCYGYTLALRRQHLKSSDLPLCPSL